MIRAQRTAYHALFHFTINKLQRRVFQLATPINNLVILLLLAKTAIRHAQLVTQPLQDAYLAKGHCIFSQFLSNAFLIVIQVNINNHLQISAKTAILTALHALVHLLTAWAALDQSIWILQLRFAFQSVQMAHMLILQITLAYPAIVLVRLALQAQTQIASHVYLLSNTSLKTDA